ncbi:MAG: MFS transporter [bacterium]
MSETSSITRSEWTSIGSLCGVFGLRMLGLFMVLPVLSPYADSLPGASPTLIGLAMGAFPLTQALFQIPFGSASDRWGRKPVLTVALLLFALGNVAAALASNIYYLILALALQGTGATASVIVAFIADLTRDIVRTRAMSMIGAAVGLAFGLGFIAGPLMAGTLGIQSIFYTVAGLSILAIGFIYFIVPTPKSPVHHEETQLTWSRLRNVLGNTELWTVHSGIFVLNTSLRALFVVVPFIMMQFVPQSGSWKFYLPALIISGLVMFPTIFLAERNGYVMEATYGSTLILILGLGSFLGFRYSFWGIMVSITLYFIGFSLLEAILPSLVTKISESRDRGTAVGIFNMSQYSGSFVGGIIGGTFLEFQQWIMFVILIVIIGIWGAFLHNISVE